MPISAFARGYHERPLIRWIGSISPRRPSQVEHLRRNRRITSPPINHHFARGDRPPAVATLETIDIAPAKYRDRSSVCGHHRGNQIGFRMSHVAREFAAMIGNDVSGTSALTQGLHRPIGNCAGLATIKPRSSTASL